MTRAARIPPAARAILDGDRRALARVISQVENRDPAVAPVSRALYPRTGQTPIIGVTGPLGVGKSSLINLLVARLRELDQTVGIVAVDPSSPFSGGSVLGDRIRFERRADDAGVFFRSMASRGEAGGVAAATREVARLLDAAGFDVVLVETVGSGQVDIAIRDIASTSVVVLVPHLGDEVQTLKAGLFEIADVFCVNKADLPGADLARKDLAELVGLGAGRSGSDPGGRFDLDEPALGGRRALGGRGGARTVPRYLGSTRGRGTTATVRRDRGARAGAGRSGALRASGPRPGPPKGPGRRRLPEARPSFGRGAARTGTLSA